MMSKTRLDLYELLSDDPFSLCWQGPRYKTHVTFLQTGAIYSTFQQSYCGLPCLIFIVLCGSDHLSSLLINTLIMRTYTKTWLIELVNRSIQWISTAIVLGLTSYLLHQGHRGLHLTYQEVIVRTSKYLSRISSLTSFRL